MMKTSLLMAGLGAALLSLCTPSALAQSAAVPRQADCSQARNPVNCAARQQARAACKDVKGAAFRQCIEDALPAPDCSKARNPQRCEERQNARVACQGKVGRAHKQCLHDALAPKK